MCCDIMCALKLYVIYAPSQCHKEQCIWKIACMLYDISLPLH